MQFREKEMEIVVRYKANGDFTVSSNTRENYRVFRVLKHVVGQMNMEMNRLKGQLVMPQNHVGHFERLSTTR